MAKPRIIIADTDINYIIPLQLKFVEEFFEKIDLEIICDSNYFEELFRVPQKADVLIVSEELYDESLLRHNIESIFMMTEHYEEELTIQLNVNRIFKYTSIKEILNEIIGHSAVFSRITDGVKKESQIVLVYSASGGVGKTTVAMGISACLTKNYKRVLYINAARLQSVHYLFDNHSTVSSSEVYARLSVNSINPYAEVKHVIRKEAFFYLPPFKASLMSLGLEYSLYEKIAVTAKKSGDYDYIVIDADTTFDDEKASLLNVADKVIVVTDQSMSSVWATNLLVSNINGVNEEKYLFVCNDFDKEEDNALISPMVSLKFSVSEYVDHFRHYEKMNPEEMSKESSMQRAAFLLI